MVPTHGKQSKGCKSDLNVVRGVSNGLFSLDRIRAKCYHMVVVALYYNLISLGFSSLLWQVHGVYIVLNASIILILRAQALGLIYVKSAMLNTMRIVKILRGITKAIPYGCNNFVMATPKGYWTQKTLLVETTTIWASGVFSRQLLQ